MDGSKQNCISSTPFASQANHLPPFSTLEATLSLSPPLSLAQEIHKELELALSPQRRGGAAMGSGSCCCMGCGGGDDDSGGDAGGGLDPKGFLLAMMIALVLFMLCHARPPRRNSYVVYRCY
ncbi:unnamed protein product [Urochloa humidicola]